MGGVQADCGGGREAARGGGGEGGAAPLQNWLFTPELQWQSRGQTACLTGVGVKRQVSDERVARASELNADEVERRAQVG
jgi:hypothetical protein